MGREYRRWWERNEKDGIWKQRSRGKNQRGIGRNRK
jgi:hypothetical protein